MFDEAQRAWDERKVRHKHRGALGEDSEPALLLRVAAAHEREFAPA